MYMYCYDTQICLDKRYKINIRRYITLHDIYYSNQQSCLMLLDVGWDKGTTFLILREIHSSWLNYRYVISMVLFVYDRKN